MQKVAIVGSGLSGMLLAINLVRQHSSYDLDITVIGKDPPGTLGQAYSTKNDLHLLNVPAHKMSAFPDRSEHFADWLRSSGYDYQHGSFVPRKLYRRYIYDVLHETLKGKKENIRCVFLNDTVIDINPSERLVVMDSGIKMPFDKVILALGNFNATTLKLDNEEYLYHPSYFSTAWNNASLEKLSKNSTVLIIGSGLSMVDTVLGLRQQEHKGLIVALSTHGHTPAPHADSQSYPFSEPEVRNIASALEALKFVRRHISEAAMRGISWHAVVDAIRPFTQHIWLNFSLKEKRRFMEHLRHIWGVARHRMPKECSEALHEMLRQQRFSIIAGRIKNIGIDPRDHFGILYQERSSKKNRTLIADCIINCMGPESNYEKLDDPLIRSLIRKGLIRTDPMRLGIDCTPDGCIIGKDGSISPWLYTIGPPAKGILWEITSVPEIRVAAYQLGNLIASRIEAGQTV